MNYHIILVNGPPRSGKDTVTMEFYKNYYPMGVINEQRIVAHEDKFSMPMKVALAEFYYKALPVEPGQSELDYIDEHKDEPVLSNGVTPRRALIHLSEHWMKPTFGNGVLGYLLAQRISRSLLYYERKNVVPIWFISDSGFVEEAEALEQVHPMHVSVIRLIREGCNYDDDSRSYIPKFKPQSGMAVFIENNGTVDELSTSVQSFVGDVMCKASVS